MKKVIVLGCPGSGKTTFAVRLHDLTKLPLYHLDSIWYNPDKTHISRENFDKKLAEIFSFSEWIIDGNYNRTLEVRFQECDTVFLFNLPVQACLQGAAARLGKKRNDMPWVEEKIDTDFEAFIKEFRKASLPKIIELIEKYKEDKRIIVFNAREEAEKYLLNFQSGFLIRS